MINLYRRFVPGCSTIRNLLFVLCRNGSKFVWAIKQALAFLELKLTMPKAPFLRFLEWDHLFYVKTDACGVSLGAALTQ